MPPLRTALPQSSGTLGSVEANPAEPDAAAARASAAGARLPVMSELFPAGYAIGDRRPGLHGAPG
ncbi:hypothetical protein [Streptomyces tsukubensis]|uniref:hypothetical protein n=1 Tax=Streptomyces tsukubensis TaxID=83656 RepID=UPI003F4F312C